MRMLKRVEERGAPRAQFVTVVPETNACRAPISSRRQTNTSAECSRTTARATTRFAEDCNRIENGSLTTDSRRHQGKAADRRPRPVTPDSGAASSSSKSGLLHFVTRIRDRRYVAVDRERGLVFAFAFFDHSAGDTRNFTTPTGRAVSAGPVQPWTWEIAELFKVENGKLGQIEAILDRSPYGMTSDGAAGRTGCRRAQDATR